MGDEGVDDELMGGGRGCREMNDMTEEVSFDVERNVPLNRVKREGAK